MLMIGTVRDDVVSSGEARGRARRLFTPNDAFDRKPPRLAYDSNESGPKRMYRVVKYAGSCASRKLCLTGAARSKGELRGRRYNQHVIIYKSIDYMGMVGRAAATTPL